MVVSLVRFSNKGLKGEKGWFVDFLIFNNVLN